MMQINQYILVVDSDADDLFSCALLLHGFGYDVFTARSAEKAIEFMAAAAPAAIVAEPVLRGTPFVPQLTQDPRFFDIPLILLSWWPDRYADENSRWGKVTTFLRKPIELLALYQAVQTAIEKSPRRNIRIASYLPVIFGNGPQQRKAFATALSEYGMFVRTFEPLPGNTEAPVIIDIRDRRIRATAVVLYTAAFDEGPFKEPGMGMKFVEINREDREFIAAFIMDQIRGGIPLALRRT